MKVAWVFEGTEEDARRLYWQLPPKIRRIAVLTPTKSDRGDWVRFSYCGIDLDGIVVDGKARLSEGAFQYLMSRVSVPGPLFFDLDDHHKGLAEDWLEGISSKYQEEAVCLARAMEVAYEPKAD